MMRKKTALKMTVGSYVAAAFLVAPGLAGAAKSYQGDDWSQDFNNYKQIQSCDQESDSHEVHSDVKLSNGKQYGKASRDQDGAGNACGSSGVYVHLIYQHRTCEEVDFWPDNCGNWVGTGAS